MFERSNALEASDRSIAESMIQAKREAECKEMRATTLYVKSKPQGLISSAISSAAPQSALDLAYINSM